MTTEVVHLLAPDFDDHNRVFSGAPIYGLCGEQAKVLHGKNGERYLMALDIPYFTNADKLTVVGEVGIDNVEPCPKCLAHPDYPLILLGAA
jgi:hypothetical protein